MIKKSAKFATKGLTKNLYITALKGDMWLAAILSAVPYLYEDVADWMERMDCAINGSVTSLPS